MRLIDATMIEQFILNNCSDNEEINTIYGELINAPTIDLVRCEECIYNTDNTDGDNSGWCYKHGIDIIGFCSEGE